MEKTMTDFRNKSTVIKGVAGGIGHSLEEHSD